MRLRQPRGLDRAVDPANFEPAVEWLAPMALNRSSAGPRRRQDWLACAWPTKACREGYSGALPAPAPRLMEELGLAHGDRPLHQA